MKSAINEIDAKKTKNYDIFLQSVCALRFDTNTKMDRETRRCGEFGFIKYNSHRSIIFSIIIFHEQLGLF